MSQISDDEERLVAQMKKGDPRFVYRLVAFLVIGLLAGILVARYLTGDAIGEGAAKGFGTVTGEQ